MSLKKLGKSFLCRRLEAQVVRLRQKYDFTVVTVAGSVGKTSTKLAIATALGKTSRVQFQNGNYNDRLTVPLIIFGHAEPGIFNILAWLRILLANRRIIKRGYAYDTVVVELGTDGPGQMKDFAYLQPEIVILTSIADEHMEYFGSLDAVAAEELAVAAYAQQLLVNVDDTPPKYLKNIPHAGYGASHDAAYRLVSRQERQLLGQTIELHLAKAGALSAHIAMLGAQGAKVALAAAAVMDMMGHNNKDIERALGAIAPVAGRMQILTGANKSILIDDTYNASPIAVKAALEVLSATDAPQRIAILGTMNELGEGSTAAHAAIGAACDPQKLSQVVTIGKIAQEHLAPAATTAGCQVTSFMSPYEAGDHVRQLLQPGTVVLAKGSQNGVFAEEALKLLLQNPDDASKLVRQSKHWLAVKQKQFPR